MRTLTATLTAAQKALSSRPAVLVQIRDRVGPAKRLSWVLLYAGAEADSYHAAVCPGDNSLVRARTDGTALYRQRIAIPGTGSDYSVWTSVSGVLITGKGIALAALGANVALFYVADNGGVVTLYCTESTDYGATWGSAVQVATGTATSFEHLAAVYVSADVLICFYTTGAYSQELKRIKRTSGVWGAAAAWSNAVLAITGISASYQSDVELLIAGKDASSNYLLWGCVYGLGINQANDTWSTLKEIRKTHSGTQVSYKYPSIGYPDVFRESFVEVFIGTQSYTRTMGLHSLTPSAFIGNLHHDDYRLLPLTAATYGFSLANNATHAFMSTSKDLYWAPLAVITVDVSSAIVSIKQAIRPFAGGLEVFLDNSAGAYNTPAFNKGWEVDFQPGYYSTAGAEYSSGQTYYIESMEHITGGGKAQLRIIALDAWGLLARSQARSAIEFNKSSNEKTYKDLIEYFLHLAGLTLTLVSNSIPFTGEYPKLSIYSGQPYLSFIDRFYDRLTDLVYVRGSSARSFNPTGDASTYSYFAGSTSGAPVHPILAGRYASSSLAANRLQVQGGASIYADAFIQAEIDRVYTRFKALVDVNADNESKAAYLAGALANKELYHSYGGEISIPVNCGQELYDVIEITDSGASLSAARRRVFGIELSFDASKGKYLMVLTLGFAEATYGI